VVVVVVIVMKVFSWKYIITGQLKKYVKKLNNNIAKQSQTYANLHSIEYVFVFTLAHYYDAFWEWW